MAILVSIALDRVHRKFTNQQVVIYFHYCFLALLILENFNQCTSNEHNYMRMRPNEGSSGDTQDANSQDSVDQANSDSAITDLRDDGLPAPNELSVIRLNDTSVVLRWDFPQESQEHLQFFKVQYKSTRKNAEWKTDNQEILTTTRAYQINGLKPGNFLFSVIAVYDNDDNVPSTPLKFRIRARSKIRPDEMPEMKAPVIYWTEAQQEFFRFKWRYDPKANDTEYYGFLVYYRSAHVMSDFTIYNTLDASVEIAELDPDTTYEAKVVAYNTVGVSEFSETITIRTTTPKQNSTSQLANSTVLITTEAPFETTISISTTIDLPTISKPLPSSPPTINIVSSTSKPSIPNIVPPYNVTGFYQTFITIFEPILSDQSDAMVIARYLLIILVPILVILFIVLMLIFSIKPNKNKKDTSPSPSSTDESMQFHLEINGYFKNSFPGVEDEYPPVESGRNHNGFVNPHIDDFA